MVRPRERNVAQRALEALDRQENRRGMLNDFLTSEEARLTVKNRQAELLLRHLGRHDAKIWECRELSQFEEDHPNYFRQLTPEEIASGRESTRTVWRKYVEWTLNWNRTLRVPLWSPKTR